MESSNAQAIIALLQLGIPINEESNGGKSPLILPSHRPGNSSMSVFAEQKGMLPIYQFLISQGALHDNLDDVFAVAPCQGFGRFRWCLLMALWNVPGVFGLYSGDLLPNGNDRPTQWFRLIPWDIAAPDVLLDILEPGLLIDPADLRRELRESVYSGFHSFPIAYMDHAEHFLQKRQCFRCKTESRHARYDVRSVRNSIRLDFTAHSDDGLERWRRLLRWIYRGAEPWELSGTWTWILLFSVPLTTGWYDDRWDSSFYRNSGYYLCPICVQRRLRRLVRLWLEDIFACGVDLLEYGADEMEIFNEALLNSRDEQGEPPRRGLKKYDRKGPILTGFAYGSEPSDWVFQWDHASEGFAGDFWHILEDPLPAPPGAWVDDDDE